jgi:hypothetical protein
MSQVGAGAGRIPPDLPTKAEVGQRVSIRSFDPDGGFRDLLGVLETPSSVRKKDGTLVVFDPERIFVWKVVLTP